MSNTVQIKITDAQIQDAIDRAMVYHRYDEDIEEWVSDPATLADIITQQLSDRVAKEVARITPGIVAETVVAEVKRILTDGFPVISNWGAATGERTTVAEVVGKMLFTTSGSHRSSLVDAIRSVRDQEVKTAVSSIVKGEAEAIKSALRVAAADGLAKLMARALA